MNPKKIRGLPHNKKDGSKRWDDRPVVPTKADIEHALKYTSIDDSELERRKHVIPEKQ